MLSDLCQRTLFGHDHRLSSERASRKLDCLLEVAFDQDCRVLLVPCCGQLNLGLSEVTSKRDRKHVDRKATGPSRERINDHACNPCDLCHMATNVQTISNNHFPHRFVREAMSLFHISCVNVVGKDILHVGRRHDTEVANSLTGVCIKTYSLLDECKAE